MATSRLRKTFKYPTEDDEDDDLPEAMDEEEQETLIATLHSQNTATNKTYTQLLLLLPALSTIPYFPSLFNRETAFLALLSITSLLCTSYLLYSLPPENTGFQFLDRLNQPQNQSRGRSSAAAFTTSSRFGGGKEDEGPIKTYLPYLNLLLSLVLALLGSLVGGRKDVWVGFAWLPGFVYGVILAAKWVMGSVDPEGELGSLRYGFKGA